MQSKIERVAFALVVGFFAMFAVASNGAAAPIAAPGVDTSSITNIDPPGSVLAFPYAINAAGAITDTTVTRTSGFMVFSALGAAPSQRSIPQIRFSPFLQPSIRPG
jgi:hypothetical protein